MAGHYSQEYFASRLGANGDPKLNAAADFAARVLNSPIGGRVARILLFGSVARNQARPDSDVDIMVFAAAPADTLLEVSAEAAWEAVTCWGEQVSPITYGLTDLFQPRSYLIYKTLRSGKEIYAMDEAEIRRLEANSLFQKAQRYLEQAKHAADQDDFELSIVGAYNVVELSAKALILLKPGLELPSSHGGMLQTFSREWVKSGEAPEKWGRLMGRSLEMRSHALYDTHSAIASTVTQETLGLAKEMLDFLEEKLSVHK